MTWQFIWSRFSCTEISNGSLKVFGRFRLFIRLLFLCNSLIIVVVSYMSFENVSRFRFFHRILVKSTSIASTTAIMTEALMFGYISQGSVYSFFLYTLAYISLFQTIQSLERKLNLSESRLINQAKMAEFWTYRIAYIELRERTETMYGFVAFLFFGSTFVVTAGFTLSIALIVKQIVKAIPIFLLYVEFFAIPIFFTSFVVGNFVEFDHRFNVRLYEFLNNIDNRRQNQLNEAERRAFLNHLRLHMRVPVTVSEYTAILNYQLIFNQYVGLAGIRNWPEAAFELLSNDHIIRCHALSDCQKL